MAKLSCGRVRPNAIIGRVVPLLLLAYVFATYKLVVFTYLCEERHYYHLVQQRVQLTFAYSCSLLC